MELKLSCCCVPSKAHPALRASFPPLGQDSKVAYLRSAVNTFFLTDSPSSLKESLGLFLSRASSQSAIWSAPLHPCPSGPHHMVQCMEVLKTVISIFDKHDTACLAPGELEQVPWLLHTLYLHLDTRTYFARQELSPRPGCAWPFAETSWCTEGREARWALFPSSHSAHGPVSCPHWPMQAGSAGGGWGNFDRWVLSQVGAATTAFTCEFCLSCEALRKSQGLSEAPAYSSDCSLKINGSLVASAYSALVLLPFTSYSVIWVHGSFQ